MNRACVLAATAFWFLAPVPARTGDPLLLDVTSLRHKPSEVTTKANTKAPAGTVELVDGQFGNACKFSFVEAAGPQFFTAWVNPAEDWNQYAARLTHAVKN